MGEFELAMAVLRGVPAAAAMVEQMRGVWSVDKQEMADAVLADARAATELKVAAADAALDDAAKH